MLRIIVSKIKLRKNNMTNDKKIHFIGICGVAMSALALTFKEKGWKVTGSDVGFYPPVSTSLEEHQIDFYAGWHPERIGNPDLVVVGNVAGSANPEWLYVVENKLNYRSYPEVISDFFVKRESIVCAGTFGKTTCTALLTWIFLNCGHNSSYMFGGISQNKIPSAHLTEEDYSILEGDEYKSARWDLRPKFFHYKPKHLLLTAVVWDHADIYKTEDDYIEVFQKLAEEPKGVVVVSERVKNINLPERAITYGSSAEAVYRYGEIVESTKGIRFNIKHDGISHAVNSPCLGEYMADNITACFALAHELGLEPERILESVRTFVGMKRRLEKRHDGKIVVIDDIAHSPAKAASVLRTIRKIYTGKIFAIFEPNTGNRQLSSVPGYDGAFSEADEVIVPRLTKLKQDTHEEKSLDGEDIAKIIKKSQINTTYIDDDSELVKYIIKKSEPGSVIIFLGSHGFRGMIDEVVKNVT